MALLVADDLGIVRDGPVPADVVARAKLGNVVALRHPPSPAQDEVVLVACVGMRAAGGDNHHDLGLFSVGPEAPRAPRGSTGLYHLAWEVPTIEDLAAASKVLSAAGALGGASDHGVSKSLYGSDPDGNEFEIMWRVPREAWGDHEQHGAIMPLDLDAEVRQWGSKR